MTNPTRWPNPGAGKIDPTKSRITGDFGFGFYTWQLNDPASFVSAIQSAINWAKAYHNEVGVLMVYAMDNATYEGLRRPPGPSSPFDFDLLKDDGFTGYELVYGPVSGSGQWAYQYKFEGSGITKLQKGFIGWLPVFK